MAKLTPKEREVVTSAVRVVVSRHSGDVHYTMANGMSSKLRRSTYQSLLTKGLIRRVEQTAYRNVYEITVVPAGTEEN